ncbi:MAG: T9SS type A sorting domain-containing protein [Bacteroidota bacterium]|nr:T9SS type A sorting domain-containing protein [Bacteroidota bacterium]
MKTFILCLLFIYYVFDISAQNNSVIKTKGSSKGTKTIFDETKRIAKEDRQSLQRYSSNLQKDFQRKHSRRLKGSSTQNILLQNNRNLDSSINLFIDKDNITYSASKENIRELKNDKYDTAKEIWAAQYGSKAVPSWDAAFRGLFDQYGNVYVRENRHTVKYDSSGNEIWRINETGYAWRPVETGLIDIDTIRKRILCKVGEGIAMYNYDGVRMWLHEWPDNSIYKLKFCGSGDIYLVGRESNWECYIQKFSSDGEGIWWDVFETGDDPYASSVAFANTGNILIACDGIGEEETGRDIIIVKYSPDGDLLWQKSYSSSGENDDYVYALAVDNSGSVYATGAITTSDGLLQMITIKYSPLGVRRWVKKYIYPGYSDSEGVYVLADKVGNILVLGGIVEYKNYPELERYYLLIKYSATGQKLWERTFKGSPCKMVLDNLNDVYITGTFRGGSQYQGFATIKYNTNGLQQWVVYYSISDLSSSSELVYTEAFDIGSDGKGNLIVVGTMDDGVNKYNCNTAVVKYNSNGLQKWVRNYDGPWLSNDRVRAIDVDAQGNIYLTGSTYNHYTGYDFLTVKFNNRGELEWADKHTSIDDTYSGDEGDDIYVDKNNNVYVAGICSPTWDRTAYLTIKYNTYGVKQWVATTEISSGRHDVKIVGDKQGNIYVGYGDLVKYDTLGNKLWSVPIGGAQIIIDDFEAIIVTGGSGTMKISSEGLLLWTSPYAGEQIAVDQLGNIYLTRHTMDEKYNTMKLNSSGVLQWNVFYSRMPNGIARPSHIAIDKYSNVYVTGYSRATGTALDFTTIKYDSTGVEQWVQFYQGGGVPRKIVIDSLGNIYISGSKYLTLKYNQAGTLIWVARYHPSQTSNSYVQDINIDSKGNIYVAAETLELSNGVDISYSAVKYSPARLEFSHSFIDFGVVSLGCKSIKTSILKNIGSEKLIISDVEIGNSNFAISPKSATILPLDSITCSLLFNPSGAGEYLSKFNFIDGSQTLNNTLDATGFAVPTIPLNVSKTFIQFSKLEVGCRDTTEIKLFNRNSCPDTVFPMISNPMFKVRTSPIVLAPYDSTHFEIVFTPSQPGDFNSILTFNSLRGTQSDSIIVIGSSYANSPPTTITSILNNGWNLVSLPVESSCSYSFSNLFKYTPIGYVKSNILEPWSGHWLKSSGEEFNFHGYPVIADTFQLLTGWNLIGSISNPVHTSSIITNPPNIIASQFFGYQLGYLICDSIYPGNGYWLKLNSPGKLILSIDNPIQNAKIATVKDETNIFNSLTLNDANGQLQTLYFGIKPNDDFSADIYELPPVPPSNIFDVRFASQRLLEIVDENKIGIFPIIISSAVYPVTISWNLKNMFLEASLKIGKNDIPIQATGQFDIPTSDVRVKLVIKRSVELLNEFVLEQNYPNPFNPSTLIKYQLPQANKIELKIYNIFGQEVKKLVDEVQDAGYYEIVWNSDNNTGNNVASGVYFYRIQAGSFSETKKLILMR